MRTDTLIVLGVLGLLVFMYLKKQALLPDTNPQTTPTQDGNGGSQQVSATEVFNNVLNTIGKIFDGVKTAAQTSPNSV